ncbi:MAG: VanZ family protein [Haloarculaceae archaeon]
MRRLPVPLVPAWMRWGGVVTVAGLIFSLSVIFAPPEDPLVGPPEFVALDKWRHFLAYAAFGASLAYATADWDRPRWYLASLVVGVAVCYGMGIEAAQAMLPERYFGWGDATANAIGGLLVIPWFAVRPYLRLVRIQDLWASE